MTPPFDRTAIEARVAAAMGASYDLSGGPPYPFLEAIGDVRDCLAEIDRQQARIETLETERDALKSNIGRNNTSRCTGCGQPISWSWR